MQEESTFEDARRWYYFATDAYNVIRTMAARELKNLYDGNVVVFMDCYDLISFLFPRDMLIHEDHYDWINTIWNQTFETLHGNDNLKICISPPSCLELFHFLNKKADYVYRGAPYLSKEDERNSETFCRKLLANQYALSLTKNLIDPASNKIRYLNKLKDLIDQRKVVNASEVFDYSKKPDWKKFTKIVSSNFEPKKAENFLREHRQQYLSRKRGGPPVDLSTLGLDSFSVNTDISNISQTVYINALSKPTESFTFTSHGVYLLLCCHKDGGSWRDKTKEAPVANSLLPLYLAKSLREHLSYDEALDFFSGAKFAFKNYLKEFKKFMSPELEMYIRRPRSMKYNAKKKIRMPENFINAERYLTNYCSKCFPGAPLVSKDTIKIGPTGVKYDKDEILQFATDKELKKIRGVEILEATKKTIKDLGFYDPKKVAIDYYPPGEETSQLLLKLSGYSFSDWE